MMESISWNDFKKLSSEQLLDGPCLNITVYGKSTFRLVISPQQAMADKIDALCSQIDSGRGNPTLLAEAPALTTRPSTQPCWKCEGENLSNLDCPECHGKRVVETAGAYQR
jgi:hypothetical protein